MFLNEKIYFNNIFITDNFTNFASEKDEIKKNLKKLTIYSFNFEQNINGKIEKGNCTIQYPKKFIVNMI